MKFIQDKYSLLRNHPKHIEFYIGRCVKRLQSCLKYEILKLFMED